MLYLQDGLFAHLDSGYKLGRWAMGTLACLSSGLVYLLSIPLSISSGYFLVTMSLYLVHTLKLVGALCPLDDAYADRALACASLRGFP